MDWLKKFSTEDKTYAVMGALLIGGIYVWATSMQGDGSPPMLTLEQLKAKFPNPPPPSSVKVGFPKDENLPNYQPATESNAGQTPSYSTNSAFGK